MKCIIAGAGGYLGNQLTTTLASDQSIDCMPLSSKKGGNTIYFDLLDDTSTSSIAATIHKSDILVFMSGITSVALCQDNWNQVDPFLKKSIGFLDQIPQQTKVIFTSSDYVYRGDNVTYTDNMLAETPNAYGKSKLIMENYIRQRFDSAIILRLSKVFSSNMSHNTFLRGLLVDIKDGNQINLLVDQQVHLLNITDFIKIIPLIIKQASTLSGTYNVPGLDFTTRYKVWEHFVKTYPDNYNKGKKITLTQLSHLNLPQRLRMETNLFDAINYHPQYSIFDQ